MLGEENVVDEAEVAAADRRDVPVFLVLALVSCAEYRSDWGEDAFEHRFSATTLVEPESTNALAGGWQSHEIGEMFHPAVQPCPPNIPILWMGHCPMTCMKHVCLLELYRVVGNRLKMMLCLCTCQQTL